MASDKDWILVEFKGTYLTPHPEGFKGQDVTREFHVQVEMKRSFLTNLRAFESLCGPFAVYYENMLKDLYPDFKALHRFEMVEATELDGKMIADPRAMKHEDLLEYIKEKNLPVNAALHDTKDLRHHTFLHEKDEKGHARLQARLESVKGATLKIAGEISARGKGVIRKVGDAPKAKKVQKEEASAYA
ncbi:MAG: hypothetical protein KGL39_23130 [Patescibacteria group bacterium]|nr:hypothetical protein [Patescibacteria group bacterium]